MTARCGCEFDDVTGLPIATCSHHTPKVAACWDRLLAAAKTALEIISTSGDAPDCRCEWCALRRAVMDCEEPLPDERDTDEYEYPLSRAD
jgi:hypothetical protein